MSQLDHARKHPDGRDEMNLADFPISALQRRQLDDGRGGKLDRLAFEATRYDPALHRRVQQRVTLTSTARDGLPTPADEHVILALLYVAKHSDDFAEATVRFSPSQLFDVMGWAPNGRSYTRLRNVLRRLKALTIRYENAWWDAVGRGYEEEIATGIVAAYRIARQVSGPRTPRTELQSWATWSPQFHDSLKNGNLKRLDLDLFFRLRSPTAQRMYRFLDKRFYNAPELALDLIEFACGHIGLASSDNVAILKRRLSAALEELEQVGFLEAAPPEERFQKVKAGVWRIHLRTAGGPFPPSPFQGRGVGGEGLEPPQTPTPSPPTSLPRNRGEGSKPDAETLAHTFYRLWDPTGALQPGVKDVQQAQALIQEHGVETVQGLLPVLVQATRKEWPECRSLSGAIQKYLGVALPLYRAQQRREETRRTADESRRLAQQTDAERQEEERRWSEAWAALSAAEQEEIRQSVLAESAGAPAPEAFVRRLCLEELARRRTLA
jgi:hypothetical protein